MFVAHAGDLISNPVFAVKICLIMLAGANAGIFHAGAFRNAAKWDVDYGYVAGVLHKAGRTEKTRRAKDLTPDQRRHYESALRGGASSALARRIAEAVA